VEDEHIETLIAGDADRIQNVLTEDLLIVDAVSAGVVGKPRSSQPCATDSSTSSASAPASDARRGPHPRRQTDADG
jgi:hypothetical protein